MSIVWAILSKVEFPVGWGGGGGFWPNIWSILVLIEIRIRIKTMLWQLPLELVLKLKIVIETYCWKLNIQHWTLNIKHDDSQSFDQHTVLTSFPQIDNFSCTKSALTFRSLLSLNIEHQNKKFILKIHISAISLKAVSIKIYRKNFGRTHRGTPSNMPYPLFNNFPSKILSKFIKTYREDTSWSPLGLKKSCF